jgi:acetylornithine deacetylase/succinyl-diaminopimelate desuccinylase-like protein
MPSAVLPPAAPAADRDWDAVRRETVAHLQALIRFQTVNPPGNELPLARYLERTLDDAGIETLLVEPTPGRAMVAARLRGGGAGRPVLLLAHMDVVGVEREHWTTDPFGGEIRDGYLYGRGAIDDKGMLAANLQTMLVLKRQVLDRGGALARDVVFLATADEEAGGEWGMGWLVANRRDLLDAEYALNEGGRTRIVGGRALYLAVQTAEKVSHVVRVTARGPGGHASIPLEGNAVFRLGRALARIGAHREPLELTATTRRFFSELSAVWPDRRERRAMADVVSDDAARAARGGRALSKAPVFNAVLRNGISATTVGGGIRHNVIPTEASAALNVRTLPGASVDAVVARLRQAVGDPLVEIDVVDRGEGAPPSDFQSPMFRAIAESARALDPALAVVPYMSTGATDSARLRRLGVQAFGILPFPLAQEDEERMHANDERIPLESLHFGTRVIYGAVARIAAATGGG